MLHLHKIVLIALTLLPIASSFLHSSDLIHHCNLRQQRSAQHHIFSTYLSPRKPSSRLNSTPITPINLSDRISMKPRILCLHGKSQSGAIMSNKIGGAKRKLAKVYDLDFLDGPILEAPREAQQPQQVETASPPQYAWWIRNEQGRDILMQECFDYVLEQTKDQQYDGILGFSQGGLLATALVSSGKMPGIKAVVTAGAPYVQDVWDFCMTPPSITTDDNEVDLKTVVANGMAVPKLHFAGETDGIIPVERVQALCDQGGNGELVLHEKGHMFPTKAVSVNKMMEFLQQAIV